MNMTKKKLSLNKVTVINLGHGDLSGIRGGGNSSPPSSWPGIPVCQPILTCHPCPTVTCANTYCTCDPTIEGPC